MRETGCPVVWTEHNGGHWIVSNYELVAAAFRDWERFSSERTDPDRSAIAFTNSKRPGVLPGGERPPRWYGYRRGARRRSCRRRHPNDCGRERASGPRTTSIRSSSAASVEFVHDLTCPVPAAVTLEWLGYPRDEWQMVLGRLPRRLRLSRRLARAPEGVGGLRTGDGTHQRRAPRPGHDTTRRRPHRDRAPRGRRRTAAHGDRGVDHVPHHGRRHRHHDVADRCRVAPPLEAPGRSRNGSAPNPSCSRSPPRSSSGSTHRRARTSASSRSTPNSAAWR